MRQGNGSELLGTNDPRSSSIGIIHVSPNDDRKSVLAAILTQEKLGRKQIAIELPSQNKAFQRPIDFDDLKSMRRKLQAHIIFIVPPGPGPAEFARQRRFTVYSSMESYRRALQEEREGPGAAKRGWFGAKAPMMDEEDGEADSPPPVEPFIKSGTATSAAFAASQAAESEESGQDSDYDDEGDRLAPPPPARTASPAGDTEAADPGDIIQLLPVRPSKTTLKLPPEVTETQTPSRPLTRQRAGSTGMIAGTGTAAAASRASGTAAPQQRMVSVGGPHTGSGGARGGSSGGTRRSKILWLAGLALLVLTVGVICTTLAYAQPAMFGSVARVLPGQAVAANVMITPDSQVITDSYVITGVSGDPNAAQQQVSAHPVTGFVQSQPQAVNATGRSQIPAVSATGRLTFYNSLSSPQTVARGTVFTVDGTNIVNDEAAVIPAANLPTTGLVTVRAHASTVGVVGNIKTLAIDGACCAAGITVQNTQAFTGGQDPKDYRFVRQSDVDSVVNPLERQLPQQATNALQKQVVADEQLVTGEQWGPKCTTKASTDSVAGDHGVNVTRITVSVAVTCTGHAYNKQQVLKLMQEKLQAKIERERGPGYQLVGNVNSKINIQSVRDGTITMVVDSQGVWAFQLNDALKQKMAQQIAGKTVAEATRILSAQKGISNVKIDGGGDTLPNDVTQIVFAVQTIPGLSANETPGAATTPVINSTAGETPAVPGKGNAVRIQVIALLRQR